MTQIPSQPSTLPDGLLARLVAEFDDDTVRAIILHGSYARGDAKPPYSDIDLVRIMRETSERRQQKQFIWREGYLLNLSSRPLSIYRDWLTMPEEAISRVSTIRDAHILLDKGNVFQQFQTEVIECWKWEPLQMAANFYAGRVLAELSEVILRTLGAFQVDREVMLVERIFLHILPAVTEAIAVQKGILAKGNNYLLQITDTVGQDSTWTHLYMDAAGIFHEDMPPASIEKRGVAALRLYQETFHLLKSHLVPEHVNTIKPLLPMITQGLQKDMF